MASVRIATRGPKPRTVQDRVRDHVTIAANGCHVWTGATDTKGYPIMQSGSMADGTRRPRRVHRLLFEALYGLAPRGLVIHHTCENKRCVNPAHWSLVTPGQHSRIHDSAAIARAGKRRK